MLLIIGNVGNVNAIISLLGSNENKPQLIEPIMINTRQT